MKISRLEAAEKQRLRRARMAEKGLKEDTVFIPDTDEARRQLRNYAKKLVMKHVSVVV